MLTFHMNGVLLQKTVHAENAPPLTRVNKFAAEIGGLTAGLLIGGGRI